MNKYFKKFSIMFVMALAIIGVGIFQNGAVANAATVGQQLTQPEDGWRRYYDTDKNIEYIGEGWKEYRGNVHYTDNLKEALVRFNFSGNRIRVLNQYNFGHNNLIEVYIDGVKVNTHSIYNPTYIPEVLVFEVNNLNNGEHSLEYKYVGTGQAVFNAIDIGENETLLPYVKQDESISLNKSSLTLTEGDSEKLTATTTPSAVEVEWSSDDDTIAKVDENGKVTGVKEGTCTVTAKIEGTDLTADCIVTVTKEDIVEPEEPSIENGSLYIEMVDGNIKRADKSQIEKFKKWFISRDLDETESPIFKITNAKGNVEYLVHDKVVGFEIRE